MVLVVLGESFPKKDLKNGASSIDLEINPEKVTSPKIITATTKIKVFMNYFIGELASIDRKRKLTGSLFILFKIFLSISSEDFFSMEP